MANKADIILQIKHNTAVISRSYLPFMSTAQISGSQETELQQPVPSNLQSLGKVGEKQQVKQNSKRKLLKSC